ncbi:MAG: hypothetical protein R8K47_00250, partial [Mariprofundaceae bacterium]
PATVPGGMAEERVQAAWAAGQLRWRSGAFGAHLRMARAMWVRARNTLVGTFHRRTGFAYTLGAALRVHRDAAGEADVRLRWAERRLGGVVTPQGLWPENRHRQAELGVVWRW